METNIINSSEQGTKRKGGDEGKEEEQRDRDEV
jgi:hypothetical protein